MSGRRGISLAEMLAVMSGCTVVLSLCGVVLYRAMRADLDARQFFTAERAAAGLVEQFRRDVHEAVAVVLPDDATDAAAEERASLVRLTLADGAEVEYRLAGATVERLAVGTGVGPPRLDFAIAARSELSLERLEAPPRLTLQLRTGTGPPGELPQRPPVGPPPMTLEATAVIGRFAAPRQENEP